MHGIGEQCWTGNVSKRQLQIGQSRDNLNIFCSLHKLPLFSGGEGREKYVIETWIFGVSLTNVINILDSCLAPT